MDIGLATDEMAHIEILTRHLPRSPSAGLKVDSMMPGASYAVLIAFCVSALARELQQAPSPALTTLPVADLLFILSADQVSTINALRTALDHLDSLYRLHFVLLAATGDCYQCSMLVTLVHDEMLKAGRMRVLFIPSADKVSADNLIPTFCQLPDSSGKGHRFSSDPVLQAVFTDATHLKLQNVSSSAQYYGAGNCQI